MKRLVVGTTALLFFLAACTGSHKGESPKIAVNDSAIYSKPLASKPPKVPKPSENKTTKKEKDTVFVSVPDYIDRQIAELRKELKNVRIVRENNEIKIVFNSQILFGVNSDVLMPVSENALNELSRVLNKYPNTEIEVQGHTDDTGPADLNFQLSRRRAAAVARYTSGQGVKPTRFRIKGFGESKPIASNNSEEGRSLNRRVEVSIKGSDLLRFGEGQDPKIAAAYSKIIDSGCLCSYDDFKNYTCKRLCDSWIKLPQESMSFDPSFFKKPTSIDQLLSYEQKANGEKVYLVGGDDFAARQILGKTLEDNDGVLMMGKVMEKITREPTGAEVKITDLANGKVIAKLRSDAISGSFSVLLERGHHYAIVADEKGYFLSHENVNISNAKGYTVIHQDLFLSPIREGLKMNLNNVFFTQSKAELQEESFAQLNDVLNILMQNKSLVIELHGHTDGIGDPDLNYMLSEDRVKVIKKYFVDNGVPEARIQTKAFGGTKPIASNDTEETRKLNRRVEFLIVKF